MGTTKEGNASVSNTSVVSFAAFTFVFIAGTALLSINAPTIIENVLPDFSKLNPLIQRKLESEPEEQVLGMLTPLAWVDMVMLSISAFFGCLAFALSSFGSGIDQAIAFHFVFSIASATKTTNFGIVYAIFLQALSLFASMPVILLFSKARVNADKVLIACLLPGAIVGGPLGILVGENIAPGILRIIVGAQMFVLSMREIIPSLLSQPNEAFKKASYELSEIPEDIVRESRRSVVESINEDEEDTNTVTIDEGPSKKKIMILTVLLSLVSSYLSGLVGVRGTPLMALVGRVHDIIPLKIIKAVGSVALGVNVLSRIIYYLADKKNGTSVGWFTRDHWPLYVCVCVFGLAGSFVGHVLVPKINASQFKIILGGFLFLGAIFSLTVASLELS